MRAPSAHVPLVDLVAIHPDQQQILVDQTSSAVRLPQLNIPAQFTHPDQSVLDNLSGLATRSYDLDGAVIAIIPSTNASAHRTLLAVFMATNVSTTSALDQKGLRWREAGTLQALYDQDSSARIQAALNLVKSQRLSKDLQEAWSSKLPRAMGFLRERVVENDDLLGWSQFLAGDSVGVLSTAQGVLTFLEAGKTDFKVNRSIEAVRISQNTDGGWPVRRALIGRSDRSITESTVYCLWALTQAGTDVQQPPAAKGIEWLERAQLSDGGWGSTSSATRARTYPTAFACRYLASVVGNSTVVRQSVTWLREAQTANGGWAPLSSSDTTTAQASTPVHTAHALLALISAGASLSDAQVLHGVRYLKSSMSSTSSEPWPSTSEVEPVDADAALDFRHFTTPWVLCALLDAGVPIGDSAVTTAMQWILDSQHSLGYWSSPLTPGQTPIWATFDAIYALSKVRQAALDRFSELLHTDSTAAELNNAWTSYFNLVDDLNRDASKDRLRSSRWIYAWNSVLTFVVALLIFFHGPAHLNISPITKVIDSALIGLVPGFAPFLYQFILVELKIRQRARKVS